VLDRLATESPLPFIALFDGARTRSLLIATFLGLLELLRRGLVRARQSDPEGEITVYRTMEAAEGNDGRAA
jgi:chromatin segregation and condensation protein Rec8/ScpA/Scc1 (kleisin family)